MDACNSTIYCGFGIENSVTHTRCMYTCIPWCIKNLSNVRLLCSFTVLRSFPYLEGFLVASVKLGCWRWACRSSTCGCGSICTILSHPPTQVQAIKHDIIPGIDCITISFPTGINLEHSAAACVPVLFRSKAMRSGWLSGAWRSRAGATCTAHPNPRQSRVINSN